MNYVKLGMIAASITSSLAFHVPSRAAQPQSITISSEYKPLFASGSLEGCALNFEVGQYDPDAAQGGISYLTGSLNFYVIPGKSIFFALKLGVKTGLSNSPFTSPSEAFLLDGNKTNKSDFLESINGEVDGFKLFVFDPGETTFDIAVTRVGQDQTLTFAYAMRPGDTIEIVSVDLRMGQLNFDAPEKSVMNEQTSAGWIECLGDTMQISEETAKP